MGFADAFLGAAADAGLEARIAAHLDRLLQSNAPEPRAPDCLPETRASNLSYGVPMAWALSDADRREEARRALRARLIRFEPRLGRALSIEITLDDAANAVLVSLSARLPGVDDPDGAPGLEIVRRLSLLDQSIAADGG